ncbi:leucine-rich repeats and immunoglobulin-like domains protein 3, partial [Nephila pilipes]
DAAFRGLESTLHNLNLKSTGQVKLPTAIKQLHELSFLDLSQNKFSELLPDDFGNLRQLTALTLERNMVSSVDPKAFNGLNGTLSSLSLLNNKIEEYPTQAVKTLMHLRVSIVHHRTL